MGEEPKASRSRWASIVGLLCTGGLLGSGGVVGAIQLLKDPAPLTCAPGQLVSCPSDCQHASQRCSDDGKRWLECVCLDSPAALSGTPPPHLDATASTASGKQGTSPHDGSTPAAIAPADGCEHRGGTEALMLKSAALTFTKNCPDHPESASFPQACQLACLKDKACMSYQWDHAKPNEANSHCYLCPDCRGTRSADDTSWAGTRR